MDIKARFAPTNKRPASRPGPRDRGAGLEVDAEADDEEHEELLRQMPEKLALADEPQPSVASQPRRVAPLEIDLGGGRTQVVHYNFTHSSGQLRGFIACEKHSDCRLYTFVHHHGSRRRTAAFLQHKADKPNAEQVDAMMLRIAS